MRSISRCFFQRKYSPYAVPGDTYSLSPRFTQFSLTPGIHVLSREPLLIETPAPNLGSELFIEILAPQFAKEADLAGIPKKHRTAVRPRLEEILTEDLCKSDRNEAMIQAFAVHKYTQQEIAKHTGLHCSGGSRLIAKTTKSKT